MKNFTFYTLLTLAIFTMYQNTNASEKEDKTTIEYARNYGTLEFLPKEIVNEELKNNWEKYPYYRHHPAYPKNIQENSNRSEENLISKFITHIDNSYEPYSIAVIEKPTNPHSILPTLTTYFVSNPTDQLSPLTSIMGSSDDQKKADSYKKN